MNRQDRYSDERDNRNSSWGQRFNNRSNRNSNYGQSPYRDRNEGSYRGASQEFDYDDYGDSDDYGTERYGQGWSGGRQEQNQGRNYSSSSSMRSGRASGYGGQSWGDLQDSYRSNQPRSGWGDERADDYYGNQFGGSSDFGFEGGERSSSSPYFNESSSQSIRPRGNYGSDERRSNWQRGQGQGYQSSSSYGGHSGNENYGSSNYGSGSAQQSASQRQQRGQYWGVAPQGYKRTDERIREDLCERLASHGHFDVSNVQVEVKDGEITLKGNVESRRVKYELENIADEILGAKDVDNQLKVKKSNEENSSGSRQSSNNSASQSDSERSSSGGSRSGSQRQASSSSGSNAGQ